MSEGAGQPGFAGTRLAGKYDLFFCLDPFALRGGEDLTAVETPAGGEVDVFDAGVWEAHLCITQPVGEAFVAPCQGFPVKHEPEPFIAIESLAGILFSEGLPGVDHACQAKRSHLVEGGMCQLCGN